MANKIYIGVSNLAREIKKAYIGINGIARNIKKMYIGDTSGIARLCGGTSKKLSYYVAITNLSATRNQLAATTVGNYALFGGGSGSTYYSTVDTYMVS